MDKKLIVLLLALIAIVSCRPGHKVNFVSFSGKITNKNSDSLTIFNDELGYQKIIRVNADGTFKDTLIITNGVYKLHDGKEITNLYLKNGDSLVMKLDAAKFYETIIYSGLGAEHSNILAQSSIEKEKIFSDDTLFSLPKEEFQAKIKKYLENLENKLIDKKLDSVFVLSQRTNIDGLVKYLNKEYDDRKYTKDFLSSGKKAPRFSKYKNFKGGVTSVSDLKGKYLYIDLWATWCQPCKAELPSLIKLEKQFRGKNITFVTISVDDRKYFDTWKTMVKEKSLPGVHLFSNRDEKLLKDYQVSKIPRFILIDPNGNIVAGNAPRPTDPKLIELLNSLKL